MSTVNQLVNVLKTIHGVEEVIFKRDLGMITVSGVIINSQLTESTTVIITIEPDSKNPDFRFFVCEDRFTGEKVKTKSGNVVKAFVQFKFQGDIIELL